MSSACPFCAIARGESPATMIAESADVIAFRPLNPATDGHTLVVPREHYKDFMAMTPEATAAVFGFATDLAREFMGKAYPDGMNLITSAGAAATQTVFHVHVHLVPRWYGDRMGPIWPENAK